MQSKPVELPNLQFRNTARFTFSQENSRDAWQFQAVSLKKRQSLLADALGHATNKAVENYIIS